MGKLRNSLLAALLLAVTASAQEPPTQEDVVCDGRGMCLIRESTLREMLAGQRKLIAYVEELQKMCGWRGR